MNSQEAIYNFSIAFPQCPKRVKQKYASNIRMNKALPLQTERKKFSFKPGIM